MNRPPVMEVEGMTRTHRHGDGNFTLKVSRLAIHPGEVAVFAGASGCGKSTLFDVLGLIAQPDEARRFALRFAGQREREVRRERDDELARLRGTMIGYVLQHGGLIPALTVADNISLPLRLHGSSVDRAQLIKLAGLLGIAEQLKKKPAGLSGGQQQRVAIARALLPRPSIVLADEPTGQLDGITAEAVRSLLVGVARQQGAALLVVTHDSALFAGDATRRFGFHLVKAPDGGVTSTLVEEPILLPPDS
jgi:putative ABC transport system ATP-binding protein